MSPESRWLTCQPPGAVAVSILRPFRVGVAALANIWWEEHLEGSLK